MLILPLPLSISEIIGRLSHSPPHCEQCGRLPRVSLISAVPLRIEGTRSLVVRFVMAVYPPDTRSLNPPQPVSQPPPLERELLAADSTVHATDRLHRQRNNQGTMCVPQDPSKPPISNRWREQREFGSFVISKPMLETNAWISENRFRYFQTGLPGDRAALGPAS